jgi:hypothetical protein
VYTGLGSLNWVPHIERWGAVAANLLKPGGTFHITETHPVAWALDFDVDPEHLVIGRPYFETEEPRQTVDSATYGGDGVVAHKSSFEWNHGIGEIITALLDAGLQITLMREHRFGSWPWARPLVKTDRGWWEHESNRDLVPLMYTIQATRP